MVKVGFFRWALAPILVLSLQTPVVAIAAEIGTVTKLPIPRYVSLRSSKINVRRGPGLDYRKDWVFKRAGWPVKTSKLPSPVPRLASISLWYGRAICSPVRAYSTACSKNGA